MDTSAIAVRTRVVPVPNPAAGSEVTIRPNGLGDWLVMAVALTLTTSATVATRHVSLSASDGTRAFLRAGSVATQAASLTQSYSAFSGQQAAANVGPVTGIVWPVGGLWLPQGWQLATLTDALDAGDAYSDVVLLVQEYPEGPDGQWQPAMAGMFELS